MDSIKADGRYYQKIQTTGSSIVNGVRSRPRSRILLRRFSNASFFYLVRKRYRSRIAGPRPSGAALRNNPWSRSAPPAPSIARGWTVGLPGR